MLPLCDLVVCTMYVYMYVYDLYGVMNYMYTGHELELVMCICTIFVLFN